MPAKPAAGPKKSYRRSLLGLGRLCILLMLRHAGEWINNQPEWFQVKSANGKLRISQQSEPVRRTDKPAVQGLCVST